MLRRDRRRECRRAFAEGGPSRTGVALGGVATSMPLSRTCSVSTLRGRVVSWTGDSCSSVSCSSSSHASASSSARVPWHWPCSGRGDGKSLLMGENVSFIGLVWEKRMLARRECEEVCEERRVMDG